MWKKPEFPVFGWFPDLQNLEVFWKIYFVLKFWNHFPANIIPYRHLFLDFLIVFHMFWKNQESWEPWFSWVWVNRHSKMKKKFCQRYFFAFLSHHYGFTNNFEILNFCFSNIIPVKYYSKIITSRNMKLKKL